MATTEIKEILTIEGKQATKTLKDLKQEIKEMKSELLNLTEGSEEYNQKLLEVGNAQHRLQEITEQTRRTTADFGDKMSNVAGTLSGISGSVQVVVSGMSLLGVEMGDDIKILKTLQSLMAFTSGIQAIDNGVKAFKALKIAIQSTTLAQKGLNAAIKANPMGAALAAATALATGLAVLIGRKQKAAQASREEAAAQREANKAYEESKWAAYDAETQYILSYGTKKEQQQRLKENIDLYKAQIGIAEKHLEFVSKFVGTVGDAEKTTAYQEAKKGLIEWRSKLASAQKALADLNKPQGGGGGGGVVKEISSGLQAIESSDLFTDPDKYYDSVERLADAMYHFGDSLLSPEELLNKEENGINKRLEELAETIPTLEENTLDYNNALAEQLELMERLVAIGYKRMTDNAEALNEAEQKAAEEATEKMKAESEKRIAIARAEAQARIDILGSVSAVMGAYADFLGEDAEQYKNIKAAEAIISTIQGSVAAFMGITKDTGGWGIAAAAAQAAAVLASGMAQVKQIYKVDTSGKTANATSITPSTSAVNALATNVTTVRQTQTQSDIAKLPDTKVYVTIDDIEKQAKRKKATIANATF